MGQRHPKFCRLLAAAVRWPFLLNNDKIVGLPIQPIYTNKSSAVINLPALYPIIDNDNIKPNSTNEIFVHNLIKEDATKFVDKKYVCHIISGDYDFRRTNKPVGFKHISHSGC